MDTMTIAGAQQVGAPVDWYVIYDDGTTGHLQMLDGGEPELSRPGRFVSLDEYSDQLGRLRDGTAAHIATLKAADEARHRADYEALIGLGVPEETARRMAGLGSGQR
jgi:hypothetical protein